MTSMVICHQNTWTPQFWKRHIYFNHLATIYTRFIWFQVTTKETCALKWLNPSFLKWLVFMAVHSRYGHHYVKDILCSTDLWRGWGSEESTLPHLLQDMGELVHINRGQVVFSYSSKNWSEPNLGSRRQGICDDPSSVRSGIIVLQGVTPGPMACRACWTRGHTISSLQHRSVREPWMM